MWCGAISGISVPTMTRGPNGTRSARRCMRWPRSPRPCPMISAPVGHAQLAALGSGVTAILVCQRRSWPRRANSAAAAWRANPVAATLPTSRASRVLTAPAIGALAMITSRHRNGATRGGAVPSLSRRRRLAATGNDPLRLDRHVGVALAVLLDAARTGETEVIAGHRDLIGHHAIEHLAPIGLRRHRVDIEHQVPAGVLQVERWNVGDIAEHDQLLLARAQLIAGVAGGVTIAGNRAHPRHDLLVTLELGDVLPARKHRLDALGCAGGDRGVGPVFVLG